MPRKTSFPPIKLTHLQQEYLEEIRNSRKAPHQEVQRASIILMHNEGVSVTEISKHLNLTRSTVYKYIKKALAAGPEFALDDYYHRPFEPVINKGAKMWIVDTACKKPKDLGFASETWTYSALAKYTRENSPKEGHICLSKAAKATIFRILNEFEIKPHKIKYYLERRDPEFQRKMEEVLIVYKEVNAQNNKAKAGLDGAPEDIITVSVDEKPGVQAIASLCPDLPPSPGKHNCISRDYEYKRLGTLSILAAVDLHDGKIIAQVHDRHRSREFIQLLKELDDTYHKNSTIRIILDNHSSHTSKETMNYLSTVPNRFIYVHTPKHGSWLNLIEMVFSKMARTFLRHIRVSSLQELKTRILKGIDEMNKCPVVFRWKKSNLNL